MMLAHHVDELVLQCGARTRNLRVCYEVHGALNDDRSNVILVPTWFGFGGTLADWVIGNGKGLDTRRYCVMAMHSLGGGHSASASNDGQLAIAGEPVDITIYDQVRAQASVLQGLGIARLHAVVGYGSASFQALQWGCLFPQMVGRVVAMGGQARIGGQARQILANVERILRGKGCVESAAQAYAEAAFAPVGKPGPRLVTSLVNSAPCDLISQIRTWQCADISANPLYGGDLAAALRCIAAPTLRISAEGDLLGLPDDEHALWRGIPTVQAETLYSGWGHAAMGPSAPDEELGTLNTLLTAFLRARHRRSVVARLLAQAFM
jgi:homoserine O-acetyltransferase